MKISELLNTIYDVAKSNRLSTPYIVGGIPRDIAMGNQKQIADVDITTGNSDSLKLAHLVHKKWPEASFKEFDDGHASINFKNVKLDFSNNFIIPDVEQKLESIGVHNPTELQKEMYSRDFTINTLLMNTDELKREVIDITGKGLGDVKNRVLRGPIDSATSILNDPKRIIRAIKMAVKFNLLLSEELSEAIVKYRGLLSHITDKYINKQLNQALRVNAEKTMELLVKHKLLPVIPLSKLLTVELNRQRMVQHILE